MKKGSITLPRKRNKDNSSVGLDHTVIEAIVVSDGGIVEELTGQIVTGGTVEGLEMHLSGPEGRDDFIIVNLSPTRGGTGEITGFDGVLVLRSGRHG